MERAHGCLGAPGDQVGDDNDPAGEPRLHRVDIDVPPETDLQRVHAKDGGGRLDDRPDDGEFQRTRLNVWQGDSPTYSFVPLNTDPVYLRVTMIPGSGPTNIKVERQR